MATIQNKFKAKADIVSAEVKDIVKNHGDRIIGEVKLSQIYQGMRGITGLLPKLRCLIPMMESGLEAIQFLNLKKSFQGRKEAQSLCLKAYFI